VHLNNLNAPVLNVLSRYKKEWRACLLKVGERVEFSKQPTCWKSISERIIGYVIVPEVDILTYVVLSKVEK